MKTLWQVWANDLPGKYDKKVSFYLLQKHWNLSPNATYHRMKGDRFTLEDLSFFEDKLSISSNKRVGFFFDADRFDAMQNETERQLARQLGLFQP